MENNLTNRTAVVNKMAEYAAENDPSAAWTDEDKQIFKEMLYDVLTDDNDMFLASVIAFGGDDE